MTSLPVSVRARRADHAAQRTVGAVLPGRHPSVAWLAATMLVLLAATLLTGGLGRAVLPLTPPLHAALQSILLAGLAGLWVQIQRLSARQTREAGLARSDDLTGLPNRRALNEQVQAWMSGKAQAARMPGGPGQGTQHWSVLLIDLDHFKAINDTYGHLAGDEVLRAVTASLCQELRSDDLLGRWGGEEFLALLPATGFEGALVAAERLRRAVSLRTFPFAGTVTVSVGVACQMPGETLDCVVARADAGMYLAKRSGRNRVAFTQ